MGATNFAGMTPDQKKVWSLQLWKQMRDAMFTKKFLGRDGAMIHLISELTKTDKGEKAIFQLVADMVGDGVVGDNEREGHEEALQSYSQEITIDLISHGTKNKGKLSDQKSVISFREQARDKLAYWLSERMDQLVLLTMSGISYEYNLDGSRRANSAFPSLAFAADVRPPSAKRHLMWDGSQLLPGDTTAITSSFLPSYKMLVRARAYAKTHHIAPLRVGGKEYYVLLVQPGTLATLKLDNDYKNAINSVSMKEGQNSPWFTGGTVTIDGIVIHEHNSAFGTQGAPAGEKWGSDGNVNGTRSLLCGAQALAMCDISAPSWVEKEFQYDSQYGINIDKMFGLLKPQFYSNYDKSVEDFGVIAIDHYQA
jgi:N4-gp56 family major capsid protein